MAVVSINDSNGANGANGGYIGCFPTAGHLATLFYVIERIPVGILSPRATRCRSMSCFTLLEAEETTCAIR
jgi:hypothetical protein